jgi:hypothetical protein
MPTSNTFVVTPRDVLDIQEAIKTVGQSVGYIAAGEVAAIPLTARVRYASAIELANAIESYALVVSFDARDFATRAPCKGDSVVIDGTRRGVMSVNEIRGSGVLISYRCGVQG